MNGEQFGRDHHNRDHHKRKPRAVAGLRRAAVVFAVLAAGLGPLEAQTATHVIDSAYRQSFEKWKGDRVEEGVDSIAGFIICRRFPTSKETIEWRDWKAGGTSANTSIYNTWCIL